MCLYVVSDQGQGQWLAYEDTDAARIYAYVANLGRFVFHRSLGQDFYWDCELDWAPVEPAAARGIAEAGALGKLEGRRHGHFLAELEAETDTRSVDEVFGTQLVEDRAPRSP